MIVAALAVVAVIYDQDTSNWTDDLSLLILGFSAGLSVYSLRSVKITVPGNKFENLASDIEKRRDFNTVLAELGRHYDEASAKNRATLRRNAVFFNAALVWSTVGFGVSLIPNMFSLVPPFINFIVKFWESVQ